MVRRRLSRRRVLQTGAVLGAAGSLAGCSGGGNDGSGESEDEDETATESSPFPAGSCLTAMTRAASTPDFGFEFENGPNPTVPEASASVEGAATVGDGMATFGEGGGSITLSDAPNVQDFTVSMFVRTASEAADEWDYMLHYSVPTTWTGWGVAHRQDEVEFWAQGPGHERSLVTATASSGLTVGSWAHVLGVKRGSEMLLYVDGEQVASATFDHDAIDYVNDPVNFILGDAQSLDDRKFRGDLDSVALWTDALSSDEVQSVLSAAESCR